MELHAPFSISARLLPSLRIGNGTISMEYAGTDPDGRTIYRYYIDVDGKGAIGRSFKSGCGGGNLQSGFSSLLAFLGAYAEALEYQDRTGKKTESGNLFPRRFAEWAQVNSDEISTLQMQIEESESPLIAE